MVNALRPRIGPESREGIERHQALVAGLEIQQRKIVSVFLIFRQQLEQHSVLRRGRVDGGNPAWAVGVVERGLDLRRVQPVHRSPVAIDLQPHPRIFDLEIGGDVAQTRQFRHLAFQNLRLPE